ncbi:MAG: hypothetical protein IJS65_03245 [Clostridia bacterium]|nr:hypothetical protein [Clostridia bacterium]
MKNSKAIRVIAAVVLVLWIALGVTNYIQTKNLKRPLLAFPQIVDQNGKTLYLGVGFSFLADEKDGEITDMDMYLFGIKIA